MKISCGTIFHDGEQLLIGHITNSKNWDIPKGQLEQGETYLNCAGREFFEETNYRLLANNMKPLGLFPYIKGKQLFLYNYKLRRLPPNLFRCNSFTKEGFPELDKFKYVKFSELEKYVSKSLFLIISSLKI